MVLFLNEYNALTDYVQKNKGQVIYNRIVQIPI